MRILLVLGLAVVAACRSAEPPGGAGEPAGAERAVGDEQTYEHPETRQLVALVNDAAERVAARGEAAFDEFRAPGSRWRHQETYIFVLDPRGNMLVHFDPAMEGKNQLELNDVNGRPIIRGLLDAATAVPSKPEGWYHYQWPVPGGLLPRWKSSYVRLIEAPSGERYVVGSGMYDDRMERSFVVDLVDNAVAKIEREGEAAFPILRDPTGPFMAKDAYVFVVEPSGVEVVNPAFPNLEGRNLRDLKDSQGKAFVPEMFEVVRTRGSGWVDFMWPKPGESVPTQKSAYVRKARVGDGWLLVGSGVYLADAPRAAAAPYAISASELMQLVRDGAAVLEARGEAAYPELRQRGSRWFRDDTYFFVWNLDGTRTFHAADPSLEGTNGSESKDARGRPYGEMFLEVARSPSGEGWVHYVYPEPGSIFPAWKSTYLKRVTLPSGEQRLVGCGVYDMEMDRAFIEDVVGRAAALVQREGRGAFDELRDEKGPFVFMDTYVFVDTPDGTELVNGGQPSLEGKNIAALVDVNGKPVAREYIDAAMKRGSGWVEYHWYKPGENTPTRKQTYARKVRSGSETFIVGSGLYVD